MRAVGIILAGGNNHRMRELSQKRAIAAMPIAGGFRAIDFALSNMTNSSIQKVAVLTQYNARSLNEHLSSSKWWDFGRKQGGLFVFTPTTTADNSFWYRGTADAIAQNLDFLKKNDYEAYGCTLLTSELDVNYEKGGNVYRSAMQKQPNVLSGEYDADRNTMYGMAPVILEYYLGNETDVEALDFHPLTAEASDSLRYYYTVPFTGGMYFYNYNTGDYDLMKPEKDHYTREELEEYLSPGNTITVKYVYDTTGEYTWNIMLPVLTVTGRSK